MRSLISASIATLRGVGIGASRRVLVLSGQCLQARAGTGDELPGTKIPAGRAGTKADVLPRKERLAYCLGERLGLSSARVAVASGPAVFGGSVVDDNGIGARRCGQRGLSGWQHQPTPGE